jgi:hypothetical protein
MDMVVQNSCELLWLMSLTFFDMFNYSSYLKYFFIKFIYFVTICFIEENYL